MLKQSQKRMKREAFTEALMSMQPPNNWAGGDNAYRFPVVTGKPGDDVFGEQLMGLHKGTRVT
jgi:hypothetical protein